MHVQYYLCMNMKYQQACVAQQKGMNYFNLVFFNGCMFCCIDEIHSK